MQLKIALVLALLAITTEARRRPGGLLGELRDTVGYFEPISANPTDATCQTDYNDRGNNGAVIVNTPIQRDQTYLSVSFQWFF